MREGSAGGKEVPGRGGHRGKKWDKCNSIINKIYFKKRIKIYLQISCKSTKNKQKQKTLQNKNKQGT